MKNVKKNRDFISLKIRKEVKYYISALLVNFFALFTGTTKHPWKHN